MEILLKLGAALIGPLLNVFMSNGTAKPAAVGNGAVWVVSLIAGAVVWLFGPGRDFTITLNSLELCGVVLLGSYVLGFFHKQNLTGGGY